MEGLTLKCSDFANRWVFLVLIAPDFKLYQQVIVRPKRIVVHLHVEDGNGLHLVEERPLLFLILLQLSGCWHIILYLLTV